MADNRNNDYVSGGEETDDRSPDDIRLAEERKEMIEKARRTHVLDGAVYTGAFGWMKGPMGRR